MTRSLETLRKVYKETFLFHRKGLFFAFIFLLALLTLNLIRIHLTIPYNSDEVSQQVLLHHWLSYGIKTTWLPTDTFILRMPLNLLFQYLPFTPRQNLFVEMWFWNTISMTFIFASVFYLCRYKFKIRNDFLWYLPLLFIYSINSIEFSYAIKNINLRVFESGLMFLLLVFIVKMSEVRQVSRKTWLALLCGSLLTGVFFYSDPAFLIYFGMVIGFCLLLNAYKHRKFNLDPAYKLILLYFVVSLVCYKLIKIILGLMGIHVYGIASNFVDYNKLWSNISIGLHGLLRIQGADFFGKRLVSFASLRAVASFTILVGTLCLGFGRIRNFAKNLNNPWVLVISLQPFLILISYLVSENVVDLLTSRYLFLVLLYEVLIFALLLPDKFKKIAFAVLLVAIAGNVISSSHAVAGALKHYNQSAEDSRNVSHEELANVLVSRGLHKGYAGFWSSNIINYLSDEKLLVSPIYCQTAPSRRYYWLYTDSVEKIYSASSFIIISSGIASPDSLCDENKLQKEFGTPAEVLITGKSRVLIYNYDIGSRLKPRANSNTP